MTSLKTGLALQNNNSSVELVRVSDGMPLLYSTRSQVWAFFSIPIPFDIRFRVPRTGAVPTSTRILRPKPGAPASSPPRSNPSSRTFSLCQLISSSSIPMTAASSAQPAQLAFFSKFSLSPEEHVFSKRAYSEWRQPSPFFAGKSTFDLGSSSVSLGQDCSPFSGLLSRLPDADAWEWPYEWEHFFRYPFVDENGEDRIIPATLRDQKKLT